MIFHGVCSVIWRLKGFFKGFFFRKSLLQCSQRLDRIEVFCRNWPIRNRSPESVEYSETCPSWFGEDLGVWYGFSYPIFTAPTKYIIFLWPVINFLFSEQFGYPGSCLERSIKCFLWLNVSVWWTTEVLWTWEHGSEFLGFILSRWFLLGSYSSVAGTFMKYGSVIIMLWTLWTREGPPVSAAV